MQAVIDSVASGVPGDADRDPHAAEGPAGRFA